MLCGQVVLIQTCMPSHQQAVPATQPWLVQQAMSALPRRPRYGHAGHGGSHTGHGGSQQPVQAGASSTGLQEPRTWRACAGRSKRHAAQAQHAQHRLCGATSWRAHCEAMLLVGGVMHICARSCPCCQDLLTSTVHPTTPSQPCICSPKPSLKL